MILSVVIPVQNDPDGLSAVLAQARAIPQVAQIVVCDDASDPAIDPALPALAGPGGAPVELIRNDRVLGAGAARNRAFDRVTGSHVLFLDADDALEPDLARLIARLDATPFDFCMFQHNESRVPGGAGLFPRDAALWAQAGADHVFGPVPRAGLPVLATVAAYPWNKIYRTAFLRDNAIGCGTTRVHNDIALHWKGFVMADTVLTCRWRCVTHRVAESRPHLTRRAGAERLQVFEALDRVLDWLDATQDAVDRPETWRTQFLRFAVDLILWARDRVEPAHLDRFDRCHADFLQRRVSPAAFARLSRADPGTAARLLDTVLERT